MGHKQSRPPPPPPPPPGVACDTQAVGVDIWISGGLYWKQKCRGIPPPPPPPPRNILPAAPPGLAKRVPFTMVRVTIGSHESQNYGGSMPAIALFDEFGHRVSDRKSQIRTTVPGSFRDVMMTHRKEASNTRPTYLMLAGGATKICITSIGIEFPDGTSQFFTGDDLELCGRLDPALSRTFVGAHSVQPKCFWLYGTEDQGVHVRRFSLHLPDFYWTSVRQQKYWENKDLACRDTPRFHTDFRNYGKDTVEPSIYVFNPVIEYDSNTAFDKYPERNLLWTPSGLDDFSDKSWKPKPPYTPHARRSIGSTNLTTDADLPQPPIAVLPVEHEEVEMEHIRTQAPRLVISQGQLSAQQQCLGGEWNHTDYVSMAEKIYCDMQSRSMFPMCDQVIEHLCWNSTSQQLQGLVPGSFSTLARAQIPRFEGDTSLADPSLNDALVPWLTTGALFSYTYQSVSLIA